MRDFPLCKQAGLTIERVLADGEPRNYSDFWFTVRAADVEKLLAEAPVVYGWRNDKIDKNLWADKPNANSGDIPNTHTARLLLIQPLKVETAEDLLREFTQAVDRDFGMSSKWQSLYDRALKLVEQK